MFDIKLCGNCGQQGLRNKQTEKGAESNRTRGGSCACTELGLLHFSMLVGGGGEATRPQAAHDICRAPAGALQISSDQVGHLRDNGAFKRHLSQLQVLYPIAVCLVS